MLHIGKPASVCLVLVLAASGLPRASHAQAYPTRPVRIIVPFPAGGTTDIIARLVAQRMSETLGQPAVVENRGGAGGSIGADAVAKAAPDGYTILMHNITFPLASVALAQANRAPYNIDTDFAGISIAANVPLVITAHPSVPANNLREFVALLQKDRSLKYNYGSTGPGSYMNIVGEVMKRDEKIDMAHIPLKGAAPLKQELLAGRQGARDERAAAARGASRGAHGARAGLSQARGGGLERPVRARQDAARDHRAAAARDASGRAPSRFGEAPHRSRGRACGLDAGGAGRGAAPAGRAVQADHPGTGRDDRLIS